MLALDAAERPSIEEIMGHPWMQGPMPSKDDIKAEFA